MGKIKPPLPVKLFFAEFTAYPELFLQAEERLQELFGDIDYHSPIFDFTHTHYYEKEMGTNLKKKFVSFKKLIPPQDLADIKITSNRIEEEFSVEGKRRINLDPGYLDFARVVLATTKDSYQRIYLGKGIYAEVTLYFAHGEFHALPWTYPDYREFKDLFLEMRKIYREDVKKAKMAMDS